ncbi:hypothetical protein [Roseiconus lacunae]|uniref:Uncharacterized protein n=1 Tax=Roseiconus lacunae TaxID=2605694 RepID=A0ABT7PC98_9BACT|nr:hypothetical protein [Roseiconus lacunae]MDM4014102.1 hypothetical protein [Roseiconus lacunae]
MDHRWRTQHWRMQSDAIPASNPNVGPAFQPHVPPQPGAPGGRDAVPHHPGVAHGYAAPQPSPPIRSHDPNAAAIYHQLSQANAEIVRLRSLLSTAQEKQDRQTAHLRQEAQARADQVRELEQQFSRERDQSRTRQHQLHNEIETLKLELANAASAASGEQRQLTERLQLQTQRHDAIVSERDQQIRVQELQVSKAAEQTQTLRAQLEDTEQRLESWATAQTAAVDLADWLDDQCRKMTRDAIASESAYDQLHDEAMRLLRQRDQQIRKLSDTVAVLQVDHETVELTNDDLDQLCARLEFENELLAEQCNLLTSHARRDQQQLVQATQTVSDQLATTNLKLDALSREKQALLETIEQHRQAEDEFDASLFAKEQEISAISRNMSDKQRQLDHLRKEHAVAIGQNDQLRTQVREQDGKIEELQSKLAEANDHADEALKLVDERDQELRQMQAATRAAEANATLQQHETARESTLEIERLETLVEQYQRDGETRAEEVGQLTAKTAKLESQLADKERISEAFAKENDGLQKQLEQAHRRLAQTEEKLHLANERLQLGELALDELRQSGGAYENEARQLRSEVENHKLRLAEYADQIATLQHKLESAATASSPIPSPLNASMQAIIARLEQRLIDETQQLQLFDGLEHPAAEAKRLSRELARRNAEHAAEREALYRRIQELHVERRKLAA